MFSRFRLKCGSGERISQEILSWGCDTPGFNREQWYKSARCLAWGNGDGREIFLKEAVTNLGHRECVSLRLERAPWAGDSRKRALCVQKCYRRAEKKNSHKIRINPCNIGKFNFCLEDHRKLPYGLDLNAPQVLMCSEVWFLESADELRAEGAVRSWLELHRWGCVWKGVFLPPAPPFSVFWLPRLRNFPLLSLHHATSAREQPTMDWIQWELWAKWNSLPLICRCQTFCPHDRKVTGTSY